MEAATSAAAIEGETVLNHPLSHSLETTALPEEVWPGLEALSREAKDHCVLESRPNEKLVWTVRGFAYTRRFEAELLPSELGCRFQLKQQVLGFMGWIFALFCARRWKRDLVVTARILAGGTARC